METASEAAGPVISNTTPLIVLSSLGTLDVLRALYREIVIPDAVYAEYQRGLRPNEPHLDMLSWINVRSSAPDARVAPHLDPGEAAAISLALATNASLILLDERDARSEAMRLGLPIIGSVGILARAKIRGIIPQFAPLLDQMIAQGRYISPALRARVLRDVGEDPGS